MFNVQMLNNISDIGIQLLPEELYKVSSEALDPDAYLVRSANMHEMEFGSNLKAIARAGAGVNNIPVDKCTEKGIAVFNTPGANANGVKELVLTGLFLSSRKIYQSMNWVQTIKGAGEEVAKLVEKGKSKFEGPEIKGKRLGVIGLGAIGVLVANDAVALGMEVVGYDPFISVLAAWGLSSSVIRETSLEHLLATCDYITIHTPLNSQTKGMINKEKFDIMKKGIRILNMARGELIESKDMLEALDNETVSCYVTDFPSDDLLGNEKVIAIPHLGASTPESEDNCAVMAVKQLMDFMEYGNIKNSVNFPNCELAYTGLTRLITVHRNIPSMVGQVTTALASNKINIAEMITRHKENIGYNIIDIEGELTQDTLDSIRQINGVMRIRVIGGK